MEITRDLLLARKAELEERERVAWANLNALLGARSELEQLLQLLDTPQPAEPAARADTE